RTDTAFAGFGQGAAMVASRHPLGSLRQRRRQPAGAVAIALEQMQCHALGTLGPYAGKAAQGLDQLFDEGAEGSHQNGSLKPGGSGMPAVRPPSISFCFASTLRTASLTAAASRSSRISTSSLSRLGSMLTLRT